MDLQSVFLHIDRTIRVFNVEDIASLKSLTDLQDTLGGLVVIVQFSR